MAVRIPALLLLLASATPHALPAQQVAFDLRGDDLGDEYGTSVAWIGDLDGDGQPEFAVGAPGDDNSFSNAGSVTVHSGASTAVLFRFDGAATRNRIGQVVAGPGDVDGDGVPDILAAGKRDNADGFPTGLVQVWSGSSGALLHTFVTPHRWDRFGASAAGAGDLDADGCADIVVGAPEDDWTGPGSGSAYAYSGRDGSLLHLLHGIEPWGLYGSAVTGAGDVNGDGHDDFAVGAPLEDSRRVDNGSVYVHCGRTGAVLFRHRGRGARDGFGFSIAGGRDIDLDGVPDLLVGGVFEQNQPDRPGWIRALSGASGEFLHTINNVRMGDAFGWTVALGDVDCDGAADLHVGMPFAGVIGQSGLAAGACEIYGGRSGTRLYRADGSENLDYLGQSVAAGTDLDGDGSEDWIVGVPGKEVEGGVLVYLAARMPKLTVQNPVAGQTATLRTDAGAPNAEVRFFFSLAGFGQDAFPGLLLTSGLAAPIRQAGAATADPGGTAQLPAFVPGNAAGLRIFLQAAEFTAAAGWRPSTVSVVDLL